MLPDWLREFGAVVVALVVALVGSVLLVFGPPLLYLFVSLRLPDWVRNSVCAWSPCVAVFLLLLLLTPLLGFGAGIAFLRRFEGDLSFAKWL